MLGLDRADGIVWNQAQLVVLVNQRTLALAADTAAVAPAPLAAAAPVVAPAPLAAVKQEPAAVAVGAAAGGGAPAPAANQIQVVAVAPAAQTHVPANGFPTLTQTNRMYTPMAVSGKCDALECLSPHERIAELDRLFWTVPRLASECMYMLDQRHKKRVREPARAESRAHMNEVRRVRRAVSTGRAVAVDAAGQLRG